MRDIKDTILSGLNDEVEALRAEVGKKSLMISELQKERDRLRGDRHFLASLCDDYRSKKSLLRIELEKMNLCPGCKGENHAEIRKVHLMIRREQHE